MLLVRRLAESAARLEQLEDASVFRTIAPGFEMPAREAKNLCIVRIIG